MDVSTTTDYYLVRLSRTTKDLFFLTILFSNLIFLCYWLTKVLKETRNTIRLKLQGFYLFCCLCGNKERLERELKEREIQDEDQILRD